MTRGSVPDGLGGDPDQLLSIISVQGKQLLSLFFCVHVSIASAQTITIGSKSCTEITSQIDKYLVILSSKTYVFEDKMTKY